MFQTKFGEVMEPTVSIIDQNKVIHKIGLLVSPNNTIRGVRLEAEDGEFIVDHVWFENPRNEWVMQDIPSGQEIIGIYGSLTSGNKNAYIQSLGFITWVPNPHAKIPNPYEDVNGIK